MIRKFTVPGQPIAQPRQRVSARMTKAGRVAVRNYTPQAHPVVDYKRRIQAEARSVFDMPIQSGPVYVYIGFAFELPKSRIRKRQPTKAAWNTSKPDLDNLVKSVLDALIGVAFIDDSQVCLLEVGKATCGSADNKPETLVMIQEL